MDRFGLIRLERGSNRELAGKRASKLVLAFVGAEKEVGWKGGRM
jgi:hypothetical protein